MEVQKCKIQESSNPKKKLGEIEANLGKLKSKKNKTWNEGQNLGVRTSKP